MSETGVVDMCTKGSRSVIIRAILVAGCVAAFPSQVEAQRLTNINSIAPESVLTERAARMHRATPAIMGDNDSILNGAVFGTIGGVAAGYLLQPVFNRDNRRVSFGYVFGSAMVGAMIGMALDASL